MQQKTYISMDMNDLLLLEFAQALAGQLLWQKHANFGVGDAAEKRML
jgi:hypothetical protein